MEVFVTGARDANDFLEWCMVVGNARTVVFPMFNRKWAITGPHLRGE